MGNKYIWSDLHLGHKNLSNFRTQLIDGDQLTSEQQNHHVIEQLCLLNKRDICFILGDCIFTDEWIHLLKSAPCRKILVGGNHDLDLLYLAKLGIFESIYGLTTHKGHWLSHCPNHPQELRKRNNVHGHTHHQLMLSTDGTPDDRYRNVCLEYTDYKPISWQHAISEDYFHQCVDKWNTYKLTNKCKSD